MKDNSGYYVIGGQYARYNYGLKATLRDAKILATKKEEYWDNWQGWHRPQIYLAADCELRENFYGEQMLPAELAQPVAVWSYDEKKWIDPREEW